MDNGMICGVADRESSEYPPDIVHFSSHMLAKFVDIRHTMRKSPRVAGKKKGVQSGNSERPKPDQPAPSKG